jgi:hypothetical protein
VDVMIFEYVKESGSGNNDKECGQPNSDRSRS